MTPEEVVAKAFGANPVDIDDATGPEQIGAWDSLGHVTLVIELEAAYGVSFSTDEALALQNVGAIKRALAEHGASW